MTRKPGSSWMWLAALSVILLPALAKAAEPIITLPLKGYDGIDAELDHLVFSGVLTAPTKLTLFNVKEQMSKTMKASASGTAQLSGKSGSATKTISFTTSAENYNLISNNLFAYVTTSQQPGTSGFFYISPTSSSDYLGKPVQVTLTGSYKNTNSKSAVGNNQYSILYHSPVSFDFTTAVLEGEDQTLKPNAKAVSGSMTFNSAIGNTEYFDLLMESIAVETGTDNIVSGQLTLSISVK